MPRISVIMTSYNHKKYVANAIHSVLDQTYRDFEFIIIDDGSTDGTVNEIKKFSDQRMRVFYSKKNQGVVAATHKGLDESKGKYIAIIHSDDMFFPDKLEKQVKFLDEHPDVAAVFSYAKIIDEDGKDFMDESHYYYNIFKQPNRNRFEWLNHFFYKGNCLCCPSVLIRKECYGTLGYPDARFAQIADLNF